MRPAIVVCVLLAGCARPRPAPPAPPAPVAAPQTAADCCCRYIVEYSIPGEPDGPDRWEEYEAFSVMDEDACLHSPNYGTCAPAISDNCKAR